MQQDYLFQPILAGSALRTLINYALRGYTHRPSRYTVILIYIFSVSKFYYSELIGKPLSSAASFLII